MLEGLYTAAAGMAAQQQRIDAVCQRPGERQHERLQAHARGVPRPAVHADDAGGNRRHQGAGAAATTIGRGSLARAPCARRASRSTSRSRARASSASAAPDGTDALTRDGPLPVDARGRLTTQRGAARCSRRCASPRRPGRRVRRRDRRRRHGQRRRRERSAASTLVTVRSPDGARPGRRQPLHARPPPAARRPAPAPARRLHAGRARGVERRHRRRDDRHDRRAAQLPARQPRRSRCRTRCCRSPTG